jgi:UDP-2-acetamido-2-deoxy-ribo-hexuluronate aminotransferase
MQFNPIFNPSKKVNDRIFQNIKKVIKHGKFILGPEVIKLEESLKKFVNSKYCLCVSSGTDALLISLLGLNVKKNDEIIVPSFSWISTATMIKLIGAKAVFVDVNNDDCNINEKLIEKKISKKTKAIICVSLFGNTPNIQQINKIAKKYKLAVIEDAAQSFGAYYKNKKSGNLTSIGCTSFFPSKPLGSFGDAGAIFTNNKILFRKMKSIRTHGQYKRNFHDLLGINGRIDTLQCAVILEKLKHFKKEISLRKKVFQVYKNYFEKNKFKKINIVKYEKYGKSAYAQFCILTKERKFLIEKLKENKIPYAIYYPVPMDRQKIFKSSKKSPTKESKILSSTILSLPFGPYLKLKDQKRVIKVFEDNKGKL